MTPTDIFEHTFGAARDGGDRLSVLLLAADSSCGPVVIEAILERFPQGDDLVHFEKSFSPSLLDETRHDDRKRKFVGQQLSAEDRTTALSLALKKRTDTPLVLLKNMSNDDIFHSRMAFNNVYLTSAARHNRGDVVAELIARAKVYEEEKGKEIKKEDRWWILSKYLANRQKWSGHIPNQDELPAIAHAVLNNDRESTLLLRRARARRRAGARARPGGNADLVSAILEGVRSKPDTDPNVFRDFVDYRDANGDTAFLAAVKRNNIDAARVLLPVSSNVAVFRSQQEREGCV